jgi:transcription-repair coupling factor (superfamily II helicase)
MLLPFVREVFAEVELLPGFTRASSHLRESAGRIRVTGLSPAAKALIIVLLRRSVLLFWWWPTTAPLKN